MGEETTLVGKRVKPLVEPRMPSLGYFPQVPLLTFRRGP